MTDREPTDAEIEAAAREWRVANGKDPQYWRDSVRDARALIALRAADKAEVARQAARIAELEGKLARAARWADVAHTSCMGTGPKQALGETLCGLSNFLHAALAATEGKS